MQGDMQFLFRKASALPKDGVIVEIGSWMGLSSVFMANALVSQRNFGARIYCVDTWQGSVEHQDFDVVKNDEIYGIFQDNIKKTGISAFITPIRKPSTEASQDFAAESIDALFVDGDHSLEGCYADLAAWFPKLKKDAVLFGHDCVPDEGVHQAVRTFTGEHGFTYRVFPELKTHYMFEIEWMK